jgi:hypothetical protein
VLIQECTGGVPKRINAFDVLNRTEIDIEVKCGHRSRFWLSWCASLASSSVVASNNGANLFHTGNQPRVVLRTETEQLTIESYNIVSAGTQTRVCSFYVLDGVLDGECPE